MLSVTVSCPLAAIKTRAIFSIKGMEIGLSHAAIRR
jgi:hypothetical protein